MPESQLFGDVPVEACRAVFQLDGLDSQPAFIAVRHDPADNSALPQQGRQQLGSGCPGGFAKQVGKGSIPGKDTAVGGEQQCGQRACIKQCSCLFVTQLVQHVASFPVCM